MTWILKKPTPIDALIFFFSLFLSIRRQYEMKTVFILYSDHLCLHLNDCNDNDNGNKTAFAVWAAKRISRRKKRNGKWYYIGNDNLDVIGHVYVCFDYVGMLRKNAKHI